MEPMPSPARALAARVLRLLDLTSLGDEDTPAQVEALCAAARTAHGNAAAVCVYPEHVTTARRCLSGSAVRVATVVNFPDGGEDALRVERDTRRAIAAGAEEIDMVLPYRALLRGDAALAAHVVRRCRAVCGAGITLKLIVESGELGAGRNLRAACAIGIDAGVDFLKTSTGKVRVNATPEAAAVMLDAIRAAGARCGFKVAGGVRSLEDARAYIALAEARLGADWVVARHFRIGASSLMDAITSELAAAA